MVSEKKKQTILWTGLSGKDYKYWIYDLNTELEQMPANYVFVKETQGGSYLPIFIGQTKNISEPFQNHPKWTDIIANGATQICVRKSSPNERVRKVEESDLINKYKPVLNE